MPSKIYIFCYPKKLLDYNRTACYQFL